jgi:hypothetical protein
MKYFFLLLISLTFASPVLCAQDEEEETVLEESSVVRNKKFDKSKLAVGGIFGLSFSGFGTGNYLFFELSPDVSYAFHPRIRMGAGPIFRVERWGGGNLTPVTLITTGGRLWGRAFIFEGLFAQVQGEILNGNIRDGNFVDVNNRSTVGQLFLGGGYSTAIGGRAGMFISILVPIFENDLYWNRRPIINMGVGVGF